MFTEAKKQLGTLSANNHKPLRLAVAVSGGSDSMALLHFVLHCGLFVPEQILCVHINHHIRPTAEHDTAFVSDWCKRERIAFLRRDYDVPALCRQTGQGTEAQARLCRREAFAELVQSGACDYVLTAHHASDNAESILMHILRGCGVDGLAGMAFLQDRLVRPFITTDKAEIDRYIAHHKITFVTDETNADITYNRNFLRHKVLPLLRERWPDCEQALVRLGQNAAALKQNACKTDPSEIAAENAYKGEVRVRLSALAGADTLVYLRQALALLGRTEDVYFAHVQAVRALAQSGRNGARLDLGQGISAVREYDNIAFLCGAANTHTPPCRVFALGETVWGNRRILAQKITPAAAEAFLQTVRTEQTGKKIPYGTLLLDGRNIPDGAILRARQDGDRFTPFGGGARKLKEFLIDKKIPRRERDNLPLLCYNKSIIAVLGVEISAEAAYVQGGEPVLITMTGEEQ